MKEKNRIDQFRSNNNKVNEHNTKIANAKIKYDDFIKSEEYEKLALHANNIEIYKNKHLREKLIKKGNKYCYPHEELKAIKEISNRDPFDTSSISEEEILKIHELDIFICNVEHIQDENIKPNIALSLLINDESGGDNNDA